MAKRVKGSASAEEMDPAEEPAEESVAVVPMKDPELEPIPIPDSTPTGPSLGQRVRGFFDFLFRLLMTLIIVSAVAIGLYYLLPRLYQNYILPVQENTAQLQGLHDQQLRSEQTIADLQTRLSDLEAEQTRHAETLTDFDKRLSEMEAQISARTESLEALEQMQATLQSQSDETNIELDRQINLLKGMELLSRARLYMYQSNFGLARQDVQSARDLLATVRADAPDSLADDLSAVILRLELALSNLPDFPVAASDDLDIAWQILLGRLPPAQTLIASATPTPQATPTPSPEATVSVTPQMTPSPTATP